MRSDDHRRREALISVARHAIDDSTTGQFHPANWEALVYDAEASHLVPLLDRLVRRFDCRAPEPIVRQLQALMLRHVSWHRARTDALIEILSAFERRSIRTAVLKGAALAWLIYPEPHLRPMADIDLLVSAASAVDVMAELRALGFRWEDTAQRPRRHHHHLPVVTRSDRGLTINVEVHVDALSRDAGSSITMANLTGPLEPFAANGVPACSLGPVDMVRHLAHHLLRPSSDGYVRLIGVVDLLRYARLFSGDIDWPRVQRDFPFVTNLFACLHHLIPLPAELSSLAPASGSRPPAGVGKTIRPLRSIVYSGRPMIEMAAELLKPPAWWLHAYYSIPAGRPLRATHVLSHQARVVGSLARRVLELGSGILSDPNLAD